MKKSQSTEVKLRHWFVLLTLLSLFVSTGRVYSALNAALTRDSIAGHIDLDVPNSLVMIRPKAGVDLWKSHPSLRSGFSSDDLGFLFFSPGGRTIWGWGRARLAPHEQAVITMADEPVEIRFHFPHAVYSAGGLWRGEDTLVTVDGALEARVKSVPGQRDEEWGSSIGGDFDDASPYVDVVLPINEVAMSSNSEARTITVSMEMDVTYPGVGKYGPSFENVTKTFAHQFELIVLSPDELQTYEATTKTLKQRAIVRTVPIWVAIYAAAVGVYLIMRRFDW